jgi:DNA-directed RNA polymerase subunit RPC12/RpoP
MGRQALAWSAVTPVASARYRCAACGNVTRFDVTVTRRTRAFHHFTVGGDLAIEEEQVLSERVEEVSCRWCGSGQAVERAAPEPEDSEV